MMPTYLNNLGRSLQARFKVDQELATIEEAIAYRQKAIESAMGGVGGRSEWCIGLAQAFDAKFSKTLDVADLDQAVSSTRKALELRPGSDISVPQDAYTLGEYLVKRADATQNQEDRKEAVVHYRTAALASRGYTLRRLQAAQKWAELARSFDIESSLEGFERSIDLISVFIGLEQTQSRRHENIARISDLSRSAAAAALEAGCVTKAIDWLERGRCLVWGQLSSLRTPVDDLRIVDEHSAERVLALSKALEESSGSRGNSGKTKISLDNAASSSESVDLVLEWKNLISEIRQKPGFEHFLENTAIATSDLPLEGTIVVINVHSSRCDAVALRRDWNEPVHIPLLELSLDKASGMVERLRGLLTMGGVRMRGYDFEDGENLERGLRRMRVAAQEARLIDTLRTLWAAVVSPILEGIGYLTNSSPQRIWWCPTGPLAFLPLHAAGAYRGGMDTASDFAVSSYTPNINILMKQVKARRTSNGSPTFVLAISQPKTPGHTPLPGTTREIDALEIVLKEHGVKHSHLEGEKATVAKCVEKLGEYSCIHFACHAFQDPKEPLASGFFLHDGRLQLSQIIQNNLKGAELAYLSACQTSAGDEKLSEEAVHLAAGMVAAGYRSVVATMWSIRDKYAPEVAADFYTGLLRDSGAGTRRTMEGVSAAEALHFATRRLRAKLGNGEDELLTWVPYVHFGL